MKVRIKETGEIKPIYKVVSMNTRGDTEHYHLSEVEFLPDGQASLPEEEERFEVREAIENSIRITDAFKESPAPHTEPQEKETEPLEKEIEKLDTELKVYCDPTRMTRTTELALVMTLIAVKLNEVVEAFNREVRNKK